MGTGLLWVMVTRKTWSCEGIIVSPGPYGRALPGESATYVDGIGSRRKEARKETPLLDGLASVLKVAGDDAVVAGPETKLNHVTHVPSDLHRVEVEADSPHRYRDSGAHGMSREASEEELA